MNEDQHPQPLTAADLRAALDRAVETIAAEISAARAETNAHFAAIDRQFETVHTRLDRAVNMLTLLQGATTTLYTHTDRTDRLTADQQRATNEAIAEIRQRLDALEKKAG